MPVSPLDLVWRQTSEKGDYWQGANQTRFSAHIGKSTTDGLYVWMIFHADFRYVIHMEEAASVKEGQLQAQRWLNANAKTNKDGGQLNQLDRTI